MSRIRLVLILTSIVAAAHVAVGQGPRGGAANAPATPRGLRVNTPAATPGYTLFAPLSSDTAYMIDLDGRVVRTWKSEFGNSSFIYFLDNGRILRGGSDPGKSGFSGGGAGGRIQEFDFDGKLIWDFRYNEGRLPHHDVAMLPNGNVLAVVWESKTADEARRVGRKEGFINAGGVWPDMIVEFEPQRPNGARVVWEWHAWDHLIQNTDMAKPNYGDPATRPERIDINGDTMGVATPPANPSRDLFHVNSIAYNAELDQIILSVPNFNELWVIDHRLTTAEAAGSTGGRYGKGGDLLYRWGNPQTYGRGVAADQRFGFEHDARWIPKGRPGAGNITVFSNRTPGPGGTFSKVYELVPPIDPAGRYSIPANGPFAPAEPVWSYSDPMTFQATYISGAERMENGNTLISSGPQGRVFEVNPSGVIVWEYWSPFVGTNLTGNNKANPYALFRAVKIRPDHPVLKGRDLRPLDPQPR